MIFKNTFIYKYDLVHVLTQIYGRRKNWERTERVVNDKEVYKNEAKMRYYRWQCSARKVKSFILPIQ